MVDTTHIRIGILTASDRATSGEYEDLSGPEIQCLLDEILTNPIEFHRRLVPDNIEEISDALIELCDDLVAAFRDDVHILVLGKEIHYVIPPSQHLVRARRNAGEHNLP